MQVRDDQIFHRASGVSLVRWLLQVLWRMILPASVAAQLLRDCWNVHHLRHGSWQKRQLLSIHRCTSNPSSSDDAPAMDGMGPVMSVRSTPPLRTVVG